MRGTTKTTSAISAWKKTDNANLKWSLYVYEPNGSKIAWISYWTRQKLCI